jgi:hypothetical protein
MLQQQERWCCTPFTHPTTPTTQPASLTTHPVTPTTHHCPGTALQGREQGGEGCCGGGRDGDAPLLLTLPPLLFSLPPLLLTLLPLLLTIVQALLSKGVNEVVRDAAAAGEMVLHPFYSPHHLYYSACHPYYSPCYPYYSPLSRRCCLRA